MNLLPTELVDIISVMKADMEYFAKLEEDKEIYLRKCCGKWIKVSRFMELSEDFMREYSNKLNWFQISMNQKLSIQFLKDYEDVIDWHYYAGYNRYITVDILREFSHKINRIKVINNTSCCQVYNYLMNN